MKHIVKYIRPYSWFIALTVCIKFIATLSELFLPKLMAQIIDDVVPAEREAIATGGSSFDGIKTILWYALGMIGCALLALAGNMVANAMAAKSSADITRNVRRDLFMRTTALSARQVDRFTVSSLISHFKAAYGQTPMRYLTLLRLKRAEALLLSRGTTLEGIARASGYDNAFYFSNAFKKEKGISPSAYRRKFGV